MYSDPEFRLLLIIHGRDDGSIIRELKMTMLTPEQFAGANKVQFDTLFSLTNKAFEGFQKVLALNLQVVKSTLAESQENAHRALSVKDAQELFALQASLAQPVSEKAQSYSRQLYEIASSTQAEFGRVAEVQYEEQNRKVQALVDNVTKNAPAGSETAVAVLKSAITAANTTYETIHKASKHAVEIAEGNFNAAATAATKAASQASRSVTKAA